MLYYTVIVLDTTEYEDFNFFSEALAISDLGAPLRFDFDREKFISEGLTSNDGGQRV